MTRSQGGGELLALMLGQLGWAAVSVTGALWLWRLGIKRYEAVGG
jgi:ABC-type uncharacterized transport system permease subunit